jgi:diguanylate cyclase (GGDEF)-like protein
VKRWAPWSLRTRLIVACAIVQLGAAALLMFASRQLLQHTLAEQAALQTQQIVGLLDQAIAAPMAQRDYATLQQTLDLVRTGDGVVYLVLWDYRDRIVAASGWPASQRLPPRDGADVDLDRADTTLHLAAPIVVAGEHLGRVDLGLSTDGLRRARADFTARSLEITAIALVLSIAALAAIAYAITRHLARLSQASRRVAAGDLDVQVPVTGGDEIGQLAASFNAMAAALRERIAALERSEAQQRRTLGIAREEQARLTTLLGAIRSGILLADASGRVVYANSAFARIWSLPGMAPGASLAELVPQLKQQLEAADAPHLDLLLSADADETLASNELRASDGRIITQRMQPVGGPGQGGSRIWFHEDITFERLTQQRAHQASIDPLTRLLNRRGLYEALQAAIGRAAAESGEAALMFIDLDDFKHANDVGGHRTGDEILAAVARALSGQMRRGEIVARLGGDEFAVLCPGVSADEAGAIAARLVDTVAGLRFSTGGRSLRVGCSIGIAMYPADAPSEDDLVACADTAMYQAKQSGKNGWAAYRNDPIRAQTESARVNWNARIDRALQDDRFVLHFQAVHRASDLRIAHHEALLRMVDETDPGRLISPADFVPHAERSGKIHAIDRWVFERCVQRLAASDASVRIAANMSARTLEDASFAGFLRDTLQYHDVDARRLHIELTETSAINEPLAARQMIAALRKLGCSVHLDDFGSGFSSFAHMKLLDVDAIKIDGSFIRDMQADTSNRLFVAAMIEIAHHLGKTAVAEQIEDAATLDMLRSLGIDYVQGYHLGRPAARLLEGEVRGHLQVVSDSRRSALGDAAG